MSKWVHVEIFPSLLWLLLLFAGCLIWHSRKGKAFSESVESGAGLWIAAGMLLMMLSAVSETIWFYFLEWEPREKGFEVMTESVSGRIFLLALVFTPLLVWKSKLSGWLLAGMALFFPFRCIYSFLKGTQGQVLWGDDHPAFLFRLFAYEQVAPANFFYSPYWNGGRVDSAMAASGANMVGNLAFPFLKMFPVHEMYNGIIIGIFIVLIPLSCALAVRIVGGSWRAAAVAFILGLQPSRQVSKWFLHFGTVGANLALPFMILAAACLAAILYQSRREWWLVVLLVLSSVLYLSWPMSVVMGIPLLLAAVPGLLRLDREGWTRMIVAGVGITLLAWPQFHTLLFVADLSGFSAAGESSIAWQEEWIKGWKNLLGVVTEMNPLILWGGVIGVWILPQKSLRWMWGAMIVFLILMSGWGEMWKPQFQLTRAAVPLAYVALVPAALLVDRWMNIPVLRYRVVAAISLAMLVYTGINASRTFGNDRLTGAKYRLSPPYMDELVTMLEASGEGEGRVLFTGATVHRFGGGHVAYLPVLTGREMMACDYYHFSPKMVEYNYPPAAFRHRDDGQGVQDFIDLYNVTHVVAHRSMWFRWLRKHADHFELIGVVDEDRPIEVYRVNRENDWFIQGGGRIEANAREIRVELDDPSADAVIRYNFDPRLKASGNAELFPHEEQEGLTFIGIRPGGDSTVLIRL